MLLDLVQSKNLPQNSKPGSASLSTLPQFFLLLVLVASFSPSSLGNWQGEIMFAAD